MSDDPSFRPGPMPVVRRPRQGLPGIAIAVAAICLALLLFTVLNARRHQGVAVPQAATQTDAFPPPPPLRILSPTPAPTKQDVPVPPVTPMLIVASPTPPPAPTRYDPPPSPRSPVSMIVPVRQVPYTPPTSPPTRNQGSGSSIVFDLGAKSQAPSTGARAGETGEDVPFKATAITNRTDIVPAGTQIPIALETPIDTSRPGLVRAIASRDTRGFDGHRVLIPRGSRFIGEYQGDIRSGQNRVLVTWSRVICPDGVTIRLASPAADQLGGAGVPGKVNSFFLQRFAGAVLQSALTFGSNLAYRAQSNSVILGLPSAPISTVGQGLIPNDYRPKITVRQGAILNVFVARDLDFSSLAVSQP